MIKSLTGPRLATLIAAVLILGMYFGLPTKDDQQRLIEKSRALEFETLSIPVVQQEALAALSDEERIMFSELESHARSEEDRIEKLKTISSEWYDRGEWILSGHYAELVAELDSSAQAYAMAANTFAIGLQRYEDDTRADYAKRAARRNYERAISIDPNEVEYRINLAVTYAERPDADNPMKGVMMLLDLDKSHPEDAGVQNTLAYYAVKTGQYDKAKARLMKVLTNAPDNRRANCLMVEVMTATGEKTGIEEFASRCK